MTAEATDRRPTEVGLGTFSLSESADHAVAEVLDAARQEGIRYFDLHAGYGGGTVEKVVHRLLADDPEVRLGINAIPDPTVTSPFEDAGAQYEGSIEPTLERLGRPTADVFYLDYPIGAEPDAARRRLERAATFLEDGLVKELVIRGDSLSSWALRYVWLADVLGGPPISGYQWPSTILYQDDDASVLCAAFGLKRVGSSPLAGGLLVDDDAGADMHRRRIFRSTGPVTTVVARQVHRLREIALAEGLSLRMLALAWSMHRTGVSLSVLGARTPAQLRADLEARSVVLSPAAVAAVERLRLPDVVLFELAAELFG